jgi:hypothetical protein
VQVENFTWDDTETDVTKVALSFYSGTDLPPLPLRPPCPTNVHALPSSIVFSNSHACRRWFGQMVDMGDFLKNMLRIRR